MTATIEGVFGTVYISKIFYPVILSISVYVIYLCDRPISIMQ